MQHSGGVALPVHDIDASSLHFRQLVVGERLDVYVVGSAFRADVGDLHNHRHLVCASDAAPLEGRRVHTLHLKALPGHTHTHTPVKKRRDGSEAPLACKLLKIALQEGNARKALQGC